MSELWQVLLAAVSASGVVSLIVTTVIKHQMDEQYARQAQREDARDENTFLMMSRVDNCAEMTHMMARKLHDAGIINGDLKELDDKNKELDEKYEDHMKRLALKYLK